MRKKSSYNPFYIVSIALGIIFLSAVGFINPFKFHDHLVEPPLLMEDFALQTANDESFRLSDQEGKIVLLFFGYTSCPDVCPTTLSTFKQVYERLGDDAKKVRFVMISADADRDTPEKVAAYVAQFNSEFIGLSGSLADLEPIWKQLGIFVEKKDSDNVEGYFVSHTASVYVIDQNRNFIRTFPYGTSAIDMTDELIQLLK